MSYKAVIGALGWFAILGFIAAGAWYLKSVG
jgi:hypothetical protein